VVHIHEERVAVPPDRVPIHISRRAARGIQAIRLILRIMLRALEPMLLAWAAMFAGVQSADNPRRFS
jgi:hypothetical protein